MNNKIDFTITCPADRSRKETIRVHYVKHDGKWFPLPPNGCDNSNNSPDCRACLVDVLKQALQETPPFAE